MEPRADLGIAANLLFQMTGKEPDEAKVRGLETYLVTVTDHGMNASTFTCRVIASTASDMVSAVTGGIGALKGPLHGGAPGPALDMIEEIGTADRADGWIRDAVQHGKRIMGFGHRIYKVRDPRAEVLYKAAWLLAEETGEQSSLDLAKEVERVAVQVLLDEKPGRNLNTNVEFYTALLLRDVGPDAGPVLAVLRDRPDGRLDGPHHRAAGQRPADPPAVRVQRRARPEVHPHRQALGASSPPPLPLPRAGEGFYFVGDSGMNQAGRCFVERLPLPAKTKRTPRFIRSASAGDGGLVSTAQSRPTGRLSITSRPASRR